MRMLFLFSASVSGIFSSCEISSTVSFDTPDYESVLVIHGVASPQSGALVLIKYNQPLFKLPGLAPDLPALEVNLLKDDIRTYRFHLDSISTNTERTDRNNQTAYFRINPDSLELKNGVRYSLEVMDKDEDIRYISSDVYLPDQPDLTIIGTECDPDDWRKICTIHLTLGPTEKPVSAISINVNPPDSILIKTQNRIVDHSLFKNLTWPDHKKWNNYHASSSFNQQFPIGEDSIAILNDVILHVAYLSSDLSQLLQEIRESYPPGEDIFDNPRPFRSNFGNTPGIFGLYNEKTKALKLE